MTLLTSDLLDTPITDFKYYRHGINYDNLSLPVYGLYEPVADRFLIVLLNETIAKQLKYILSSRYHLHVCRMDVAHNYVEACVNNANCDKWTLTNKDDINFSNPIVTTNVLVKELCFEDALPRYNILNEKLWCLFCTHWLYTLNNETDWPDDTWYYSKIDNFLNSFLNIEQVYYPTQEYQKKLLLVKNDILKVLYMERDFKTAEQAIETIINPA